MGFTPIENGESALSVREKINSLEIGNNIKLTEETKGLYGVETVDEALKSAKTLISNTETLANTKIKIVTGTYTGTWTGAQALPWTSAPRTINLPSRPRALFIYKSSAKDTGASFELLVAATYYNTPIKFTNPNHPFDVLEIGDTYFRVASGTNEHVKCDPMLNLSGETYYYVAFIDK